MATKACKFCNFCNFAQALIPPGLAGFGISRMVVGDWHGGLMSLGAAAFAVFIQYESRAQQRAHDIWNQRADQTLAKMVAEGERIKRAKQRYEDLQDTYGELPEKN